MMLSVFSQSSHKEHTPQRIPVGIKSSSSSGKGSRMGRVKAGAEQGGAGQGGADEQQIHTHSPNFRVFRLQGTKKSRQYTHTHTYTQRLREREGRKRLHIYS